MKIRHVISCGLLVWLALSCAKKPSRTNPFDPGTPNVEPAAISLPVDSAIGDVGSNSIEILWGPTTEEDFYRYVLARWTYQKASSSFIGEKPVAEFTQAYKGSYVDKAVKPGSLYRYRLIVEDQGGLKSISNPVTVLTAPLFNPKGSLPPYIEQLASTCAEDLTGNSPVYYYAALVYDSRRGMHYVQIFPYPISSGSSGPFVPGGKAIEVPLEEGPNPMLVGRKSPLANHLYTKLTTNSAANPINNTGPGGRLSLDQAIDSGYVIEPDLKTGVEFTDLALTNDFRALFVAFNFYIFNNDSSLKTKTTPIKKVSFFGVRGIMKFAITGSGVFNTRQIKIDTIYNTLVKVTDMRPMSKIFGLELSKDMKELYLQEEQLLTLRIKSEGFRKLGSRHSKGLASSLPSSIQPVFPMEKGTLGKFPPLAVQGVGNQGTLLVGTTGKIVAIGTAGTDTLRHPLISNPQSIHTGKDGGMLVIDPSTSGIVIFNAQRKFLSKWSQTRHKKLEFSEMDKICGAGDILFFNNGQEIWGNF